MINLNKKKYSKIILFFILLGLGTLKGANMNNIKDVSMIELISNPNKFNGQAVRLIGYLYLDFEAQSLFLSKDYCENSIMKNALWLSFVPEKLKEYKKGHAQYVIIEGTFNSAKKGHFGMYSGTIESISRLDIKKRKK